MVLKKDRALKKYLRDAKNLENILFLGGGLIINIAWFVMKNQVPGVDPKEYRGGIYLCIKTYILNIFPKNNWNCNCAFRVTENE